MAQRNEKLNSEIAALAAGDTKTIALTDNRSHPRPPRAFFLEPTKRRAVVFSRICRPTERQELPALDHPCGSAKAAERWRLRSVASGQRNHLDRELPVATEIKALAVTMEPRGGVEQPTNTNFY